MSKNSNKSSENITKADEPDYNYAHESTFKIIFEQSPISTQIFAPDGTLLKANKAWEKLWGVKLEDIKGYNILKDKQLIAIKIMPLIQKAFKGHNVVLPPVKYEPNKTIKDVSAVEYRWTQGLIYPIKDSKDNVINVILQHEDISEVKRTEDELKFREEYFRTSFEQAAVGMAHVSLDGRYLKVNQKLCEIMGYSEEELLTQKFKRFTHPDDIPASLEAVKLLISGKVSTYSFEKRYLKKDNKIVWVKLTISLFKGNDGKNKHFISIFEDITKRKKYEDELRYQKTLLEAQREVAPVGVLVVSPTGEMVSYNNKFVKMWQFSEDLMSKGKDNLALYEATQQLIDPKLFIKRVKEIYKNHTPSFTELRFKDGRVFDRYGSPIIGDDGTNYGYVWFFQDVSERKRLEKQKDEFLGIASHELKTPVTSLKAFCQVLQSRFKKDGNEKSVILLEKMDSQIDKLTNLIEDLLDISKIEGGRLKFHDAYFNFDELVIEVVEELQRTTEKHTLINNGATDKTVFGDRERIGQVIINFLTNAIKYSQHSEKIVIQLSTDNKELKLCVKDFGVGIPKDTIPHVFERFYRVKGKNHDTVPGMGLGLYIASEIINRQGGRIWAQSTQGKGSSFCFTMPLESNVKAKIKNMSMRNEIKHE